jgi:mannose-6-phosphate isomerase-like protein (cupin superfamily)
MSERIVIAEKFARFHDVASPKVVAELNGQHVKLVRFRGTFVWHRHEHEDELFWVLEGRLRIDFRDREVWLGPGEMLVVPRGVEHRPHADDEVKLVLFEPASTLNTGNVRDARTIERPERI